MGVFDPAASADRVLESLLDVSDDAVVTTDLNGLMVSWNGGAARLYGFAAAEVIGTSIERLVPQGEQPALRAGYQRVRSGHRADAFDVTRVAKDGRLLYVSSTLSPIRGAGNTVVGVLAVTRDIRTQKRS